MALAYPTIYDVTYSYTGFQFSQQGISAFPGTQLDSDLAGLQASVSSLALFVQGVLRSDGQLQNGAVTYDSLSTALQTAGLAPATAWLTATSYLLGNAVTINSSLYRCLTPHTSGVFATDLAAANWVLVSALITGPQGAAGAAGANGAAALTYGGTSVTSLLIANSVTKTFATQAGLAYQVGSYVRASSAANGANYMEGLVSAYSGTSLSIGVTKIGGSGTYADWGFAVSGAPGSVLSSVIDVTAYGATGNTRQVVATVTINSGSPNLTATGATFVSGDVGKVIEVPGAGAAGAGLVTTILTFTDATHVVLAANAATTVTATSKTIYYGTDDTAAIQAAFTAAAATLGATVYAPHGGYMCIGSGSSIFGYGAVGGTFSGESEMGTIFYLPSSIGTSRDFLLFQGSATGIVLQDFLVNCLGATSGRHIFQFDSTGGQFYRNVLIQRIFNVAPSGHVVYINNTGSVGGSVFHGIIRDCNLFSSSGNACIKIVKGGDSIFIDHNLLSGSGYAVDSDQQSGAGQLIINANNITASAMVKIAGATAPIITYNEFEQLSTNTETNNTMLDIVGPVDCCKIVGNQIQALASFGNPSLIRINNASDTVIDSNRLYVPAVYNPIIITASATNTKLGAGNSFPGAAAFPSDAGTSTRYGSPVYFSASLSANQSAVSATFAKLLVNTELVDSHSFYDNATNYRFQPAFAGKYRIHGQVQASGTAISEVDCDIYKNGSVYARTINLASGAATSTVIDVIVSFNGSTDYVELFGQVIGTGTLNFLGGTAPIRTWFEAVYIGP